MTKSELAIIAKAIGAATRPLRDRIAALESQVKGMPGICYRGVWSADAEYQHGDVVTLKGSMWFCKQSTAARPEDSQSSSWQLCVKAGRDGRDAR